MKKILIIVFVLNCNFLFSQDIVDNIQIFEKQEYVIGNDALNENAEFDLLKREIQKRPYEVKYNATLYIVGKISGGEERTTSDLWKEINITTIDDNGNVVASKTYTNNDLGEKIYFELNLNKLELQDKFEIKDLVDTKATITFIDHFDKKKYINFTIKYYTIHVIADLSVPEKGDFGAYFWSTVDKSIFKTQVNLSHFWADNLQDENWPIVFSMPLISANFDNLIIRNIEFGINTPVTFGDDPDFIGWGFNLGLLKTKANRTAFQFGMGTFTKDIGVNNVKNEIYYYIGFDLITGIEWLTTELPTYF